MPRFRVELNDRALAQWDALKLSQHAVAHFRRSLQARLEGNPYYETELPDPALEPLRKVFSTEFEDEDGRARYFEAVFVVLPESRVEIRYLRVIDV